MLGLLTFAFGFGWLIFVRLSAEQKSRAAAFKPTAKGMPKFRADFSIFPKIARAGELIDLTFAIKNGQGNNIRYLQNVHEKPLHLIVVSDDLAEFYHIHPEWQSNDTYSVKHIFPFGGRFQLFADYTPPGSGQILENFELNLSGKSRSRAKVVAAKNLLKIVDGLQVKMSTNKPLRVGEEVEIKFALSDEKTGQPVTDLQFYLAALAHIIVISADFKDFIHAHPLEPEDLQSLKNDSMTHVHNQQELQRQLIGPSPPEIVTKTAFPRAGLYKLWAQFQRHNQIITVPFVLNIAENKAEKPVQLQPTFPADAISVTVAQNGYEPSSVEAKADQPIKLAFYRKDAQNCGGTIVFPELGIKRELAVGQVVTVELPAQPKKTLFFTCDMKMMKGAIVIN